MKARLKTIVLSAFSALAVFSAVTYSSCENDKCKSIVCAYGGVCTDGQCLCLSGYEGAQCETITRQRYLGSWVVTENGSVTEPAQYTVSIEPGDNISELRIKSLRNLFTTAVSAYVIGDSLYIPEQITDDHDITGYGYMTDEKFYGDNGKLVVYYRVTNRSTGLIDYFGLDEGEASIWNK